MVSPQKNSASVLGDDVRTVTFDSHRRQLNVATVTQLLGPPLRQAIMQSSGTPLVRELTWSCGCILAYRDDRNVIRWSTCDAHRDAQNEWLPGDTAPERR